MDDGTGFDLLKKVHAPTFQLIFTTAFNQYAVQAFKFSALDYLMKPVDPEELKNSLLRATQAVSKMDLEHQLTVLRQQLSSKPVPDRQIVLKDMHATYFVKVRDILYCMAEGAYTQFYLLHNDPILVSRNLHTHEEMLAPSGFIRTHHSYLVNPQHIKSYDRATDCVVLVGGHSVAVSQRKRDTVMQLLENR
jgi:two-component system LytT family response regulator